MRGIGRRIDRADWSRRGRKKDRRQRERKMEGVRVQVHSKISK